MTFYNEHSKVWLSVDCIIFGFDDKKLKILVGKRKMDPGRGQWSLYGGFVGATESVDEAATRTLYELTGLRNVYMRQIGAFGKVDRDPGERVVSVAYYALINVGDYDEKLREAFEAEWVDIENIPELYSDHNEMVAKARKLVQQGGATVGETKITDINYVITEDMIGTDGLLLRKGKKSYCRLLLI